MLDIMLDNPRLFDLEGKRLCRFCKFWKRYTNLEGEWGRCVNDDVQKQLPTYSELSFSADFGCIHFEVKNV